jgi:hypothetical protein
MKMLINSIILFCTSASVHWVGSRFNGLTLDDAHTILKNPVILSETLPSIKTLLSTDYWGTPLHHPNSHQSFRPVTTVSFYIDAGGDPASPQAAHRLHQTSILLHAACSVLVFGLAIRLHADSTHALLGGLLFSVHPIVTESVANVTGRAETLAAFFGLLYYLVMTAEKCTYPLSLRFCLGIPLSLLATFSKEVGFASTIVAAVHLWMYDESWISATLATLLSFAVASIRLQFLYFKPSFNVVDNPLSNSTLSWKSQIMSAGFVNTKSLALLFNPFSVLCPDYSGAGCPIITDMLDYRNLYTLFIGLLIVVSFVFSIQKRESSGTAILVLLWWAVPMSLASNVFLHIGFCIGERALYSPLIGVSVGFAVIVLPWCQRRTLKGHRWILASALLACFVAMTERTIKRDREWSNNLKLWTSAERQCVVSGRILNNLGKALQRSGNFEVSKTMYERAIKIQPDGPLPYFNLGMLEQKNMNCTAALIFYKQAVERHPMHTASWNNMGACALQSGKRDDAIHYFTKALTLAPGSLSMKNNLKAAIQMKT